MRRVTWTLATAVAILGAFALGLALHPLQPAHHGRATTYVDQVRGELAARYYRAVTPRVLRLSSVPQMLRALHDPYTEFLGPAAFRLFQRETAGSYSGVGLTVLPGENGLLVTRTQPGPARVAGMRPGDTILSIDGAPTASLSFDQGLGRIIGKEGSTVSLRVLRGGRTIDYRLVRRHFQSPSVHSRLLADGVGYLRLSTFSLGSAQALETALQRLEARGATRLVLDLRGNPGGLLDQAIEVASIFLDRGIVVSIRGAHQRLHVYDARPLPAKTRLPLAVLVDKYSASAAEVVAAALHDHHRAALVGESTFGKALVQDIFPLARGAALKLTIASYLTPAGTDISRGGVHPDIFAAEGQSLAVALTVLD